MVEAAYNARPEPANNVEVIIHIDEELEEMRRSELTNALENTIGIRSAEFCPLRYHLILVQYDRDRLSSLDVLETVRSHSIHGQLIGPV